MAAPYPPSPFMYAWPIGYQFSAPPIALCFDPFVPAVAPRDTLISANWKRPTEAQGIVGRRRADAGSTAPPRLTWDGAHEAERMQYWRATINSEDRTISPILGNLAELLVRILGVSIAGISLIYDNLVWHPCSYGMGDICYHASKDFFDPMLNANKPGVFVSDNTALDRRFVDCALVRRSPYCKFYCGAPLVSATGTLMGVLYIMDSSSPRTIKRNALAALANLAVFSNCDLFSEQRRRHQKYSVDPTNQVRGSRARWIRREGKKGVIVVDITYSHAPILWVNSGWRNVCKTAPKLRQSLWKFISPRDAECAESFQDFIIKGAKLQSQRHTRLSVTTSCGFPLVCKVFNLETPSRIAAPYLAGITSQGIYPACDIPLGRFVVFECSQDDLCRSAG